MLSFELQAKQAKDKERLELESKRAPGKAAGAELDIEAGDRASRSE